MLTQLLDVANGCSGRLRLLMVVLLQLLLLLYLLLRLLLPLVLRRLLLPLVLLLLDLLLLLLRLRPLGTDRLAGDVALTDFCT